MRKSTLDALKTLDAWRKAYKKMRWAKDVVYDFVDAYCDDTSPVSAEDAPEIKRLLGKFEAYEEKATAEWEKISDEVDELKKRFRHNKPVTARLDEIGHYIAVSEGLIFPD